MLYTQSPSLAENEAAQENSPRGFARDPEEDRSEPRFGRRPTDASSDSFPPPRRPSIGRRMFRAVTRFVIVVAIGVGATLGWQAYGDMAKQMFAACAPEFAWVLPWLPATKPPAAVAAAAHPTLQLEPLVANLEFMRRSVEQLAFKQDQMARNIAALQAVDEDIRQKVSPPPAAPAQPVAAIPQPKPAPPKPQPQAGAPAPRPPAPAAPVSILPR
ncbi:hypothetical protein [Bradyrhizobium sp.]|uniref:hypothetical protein n=1 Tax=Bradyrhizobium sp. TaxID=376 RepID=UPI001D271622|nr:hypothetical protein [Bradyrhizobium sp.]MBI5320437.1 hypothetical protein [Bradyrhizobium sp.]